MDDGPAVEALLASGALCLRVNSSFVEHILPLTYCPHTYIVQAESNNSPHMINLFFSHWFFLSPVGNWELIEAVIQYRSICEYSR
jgi:hypothetical protein